MSEAPTPSGSPSAPPKKSGGVGLGALIGIGIGVIVLSFFASFLGASWARSMDEASEPTPTPRSTDEVVAAIESILPAGSAVRVGSGAPESGKGREGDAYIDRETADVWVFRDGDWVVAGNIRTAAAENLTGQPGPAGPSGAPGAPGEAGTQIVLGVGEPDPEQCVAGSDDIYIDTEAMGLYQCVDGEWVFFERPDPEEQTPTP